MEEQIPPVRVGEEMELEVIAIGGKGDGISKVNNFVVFIPSGRKGEKLQCRITKVSQKYAFAEIIG